MRDPATARAPWLVVSGVLGAGFLVRLLFAALIPLFGDEAYYWEWSRRLAAGYFDHPPGIAVLVRGGTMLFGAVPLGVRVLPVLSGLIAALATAGIAYRLAGDRGAFRAALVITCMPLAAAGLVLATPDAPLLATVSLGAYGVVRAIQSSPGSRASLGWWCASGVALGLAFSSKYTSILMPVGVTLAILARPSLRVRLREPGPYLACVIATLIFLPVLRWNAAHDWVSFGFQVHHGLATPARRDLLAPLKRLGDMIGGQAGLVSPILFVLCAVAVSRGLRRVSSDAAFVLAMIAAFSFLFFCYSATRQRVEANWPAPAYIAAIPLLAALAGGVRLERWLRAGIWLAAVLSAVIYLHAAFEILPIPPRKDPLARAAGWRDLAVALGAAAGRASSTDRVPSWIAADRYQDASEVAFHLPNHPMTFSLNLSGRSNQFDLWPGFADTAHEGDDLAVAVDETADTNPIILRLAPFFETFARDSLVDLRNRHGLVTQRRIWIMRRWRGGWPPRS
ncbi:MAG TPA: glycosyltransferase family 39 protein [Gemmatimonadaceae bacterium]|nr:glycosyltransferase family 39 protein [Gemmatimonadaceae bacterium]